VSESSSGVVSSRKGSGVKKFTREHLVSADRLGGRFLDVLGSVVTSIVSSSSKTISKDVCLSAASEAVRRVLSTASDIEKTYAVPVCNDLRRLCIITIGRDDDWSSNDVAQLAPVGEFVRDVYEIAASEGLMDMSDLVRFLSVLSVVVFEYRDKLGIKCHSEYLMKSLGDTHRNLLEDAAKTLREIFNKYPDLVAAAPAKLWSLALKRSGK